MKQNWKRLTSALLVVLMLAALFTGCGSKEPAETPADPSAEAPAAPSTEPAAPSTEAPE